MQTDGALPSSISLVVPAFNEEENVGPTIEKATRVLSRLVPDFEIVVVNDGSRDRTGNVVREHAGKDPRVRLVDHPVNRGMGAGVRSGIQASTKEWIFETCADLQFDLDEIADFLPHCPGSDMVVGYRVNLRSGPLRSFVTWTYRKVIRILFGLSVKDPSWVKMMRRERVQPIPITSDGFFWETEILVRAKLRQLRMTEVGVHWHPRTAGQATGGSPRRIFEATWTLVKFWARLAAGAEQP